MNFINKMTVSNTESMTVFTIPMECATSKERRNESGYKYDYLPSVFNTSPIKNPAFFCQVVSAVVALEKNTVIVVLTCMFIRHIIREPEIFEVALFPDDNIDIIRSLLENFSVGRTFVIRRPTVFQDESGGYYITLF